MNLSKSSILVTGATGFVGRNLVSQMKAKGLNPVTPSRQEFDLSEQSTVRQMLAKHRPEVVFHLAGLVGGIVANRERPADFNYQNQIIGACMLHESWKAGVKKFITLIGGCSYPATAPNPIKETELFNGYPQKESAAYSLAKAMSVVQAQAYREQYGFNAIVLVPGNLYGPHDNFDLRNSHVIPALVRKYVEAKATNAPEIGAWGTGKAVRDFVYVGDACEAILIAAESYDAPDIINISSGKPVTIRELTELVAEAVGYPGKIAWDPSKPEGQLFKGFDVARMKELLRFECKTTLKDGLKKTVDWFVANQATARLTG